MQMQSRIEKMVFLCLDRFTDMKQWGRRLFGHNSLMNLERVHVVEEMSYNFESMSHVHPVRRKWIILVLNAKEKKILDRIISKFKDYKAKDIVDYMHRETAYTKTENGAIIPFSLAKEIKEF